MIDPLHGDGYAFWSGIGGALVGPILLGAAYRLGLLVAPTRCAALGCKRKATATSAAGAHFCREHLPEESPA